MSPAIRDDRLQQIYDYWRRKTGARGLPSRRDIDPTEIPHLLPHLMLVDVLGNGRYRYRLVGTEVATAMGVNATGRLVHEMLREEQYCAYVLDLYDTVVRERRAVYTENVFLSLKRDTAERNTKRLMLPLSADGERVTMVLAAQVFAYLGNAARNRHLVDPRPHDEVARAIL
jgi:hypothetical protein